MTTALLASILVLGQMATAPPATAAADRAAEAPVPACVRCGADTAAMARLLDRLQTARVDLVRYHAVVALRRFDVQCHPEIVPVLIGALQHDREDAVRAEAAISMARMGANRPDVVAALEEAAAHDRATVRLRANWSLKHLARRAAQ